MRTSKALVIAAIAVIAVLAASYLVYDGEKETESFIIIHSNDTHCYYGDDGNLGFSTLKSLRDQKVDSGDTVFLVDAGDFLQGNAYGTLTDGESSIEVLNAVGYDVGVPGNHDFDFTFEVMLDRISELNYPIICSNLIYGSTGESVLPEYLILEKDGIRLGCFGLLTPDTPTTTKQGNMGDAVVTDAVEAAGRMVSLLSGMDVDYIVAIGHIGVIRSSSITSDAICNEVPGIDIFIDGHSHTAMENGKVLDGSIELIPTDTVIASTGCYNKSIGIVTVSEKGEISAKLYHGAPLNDYEIEEIVEGIHARIDTVLSQKICHTDIDLDGETPNVRSHETNLADLLTDCFRISMDADIGIVNGGGIRTSIKAGDITLKNALDVTVFQNDMVTLTLPGSVIYQVMEISLGKETPNGGFIQVSGITVTYDLSKDPGSRVVSIDKDGVPLDRDSNYTVATLDFLSTGGDGYDCLIGYDKTFGGDELDVFSNYLKGLGNITETTIEGGRLVSV